LRRDPRETTTSDFRREISSTRLDFEMKFNFDVREHNAKLLGDRMLAISYEEDLLSKDLVKTVAPVLAEFLGVSEPLQTPLTDGDIRKMAFKSLDRPPRTFKLTSP
jgi:hypothetical protein